MAIDFSQLKDQGATKILYAYYHPFSKDLRHFFCDIALLETFILFFLSYLSIGPLIRAFTFSLNVLTIVA
jgi:hypothetical protein